MKSAVTSTTIITAIGILTMLLSGEIFYKVMMALTCGSIFISLSMAVTVEAGKFFFTRMIASTKASSGNLIIYRGVKGIMVTFSLMASLFFFSQFLSDKSNMANVMQQARADVDAEFNRKAEVLKAKLQGVAEREVQSAQALQGMTWKDKGYWHAQQDRKLARQALESERQTLTRELLALETSRGVRLAAIQPALFAGDERARNPQLNAMVGTLRNSGLPVNYHFMLLGFCVLISIFLEAVIHISAALPAPRHIPVERKKRNTTPIRRAA